MAEAATKKNAPPPNPIATIGSALGWVVFFAWVSGYRGADLLRGFTLGFCLYVFNEMFIHYILFHVVARHWPASIPPPRLYYKVHGVHHRYPADFSRTVLPVAHQWCLVAIMVGVWRVLFLTQPFSFTLVLGSGLMAGYACYEVAHIYAHGHPLVAWMTFLEPGSDFHMYHHRRSSRRNFGFVSPLGDWLCGTIAHESDCNPFRLDEALASVPGFLAALPVPVPFYHWIMMSWKRKVAGAVKRPIVKYSHLEKEKKAVEDPTLM